MGGLPPGEEWSWPDSWAEGGGEAAPRSSSQPHPDRSGEEEGLDQAFSDDGCPGIGPCHPEWRGWDRELSHRAWEMGGDMERAKAELVELAALEQSWLLNSEAGRRSAAILAREEQRERRAARKAQAAEEAAVRRQERAGERAKAAREGGLRRRALLAEQRLAEQREVIEEDVVDLDTPAAFDCVLAESALQALPVVGEPAASTPQASPGGRLGGGR